MGKKKGKKEKGQGGAEKGNCGGCQCVRLPDPGTTDSSRDIWLLKECIDHCPTSSMGHTINAYPAKNLLFPMFALWARSPARNLQIFSRLKTSSLGNFALSGIIYLDWWLNPGKMVILMIVCLSSSCFLPIIFTSTIPSLSNSKHIVPIVSNLYCSKSPHWCILSFSWGSNTSSAWNPWVSQAHFWCRAVCKQIQVQGTLARAPHWVAGSIFRPWVISESLYNCFKEMQKPAATEYGG